ncbi:BA75_03417T0 [Komagataella pastoris]|uniref:BA75_03417T0 n=1 Tax=Komagataella pastoris TaxID=4922 RepID=A0A1B2JFK1_PICPA|nr:BA75_03417T0 [Komagataella pastoris]
MTGWETQFDVDWVDEELNIYLSSLDDVPSLTQVLTFLNHDQPACYHRLLAYWVYKNHQISEEQINRIVEINSLNSLVALKCTLPQIANLLVCHLSLKVALLDKLNQKSKVIFNRQSTYQLDQFQSFLAGEKRPLLGLLHKLLDSYHEQSCTNGRLIIATCLHLMDANDLTLKKTALLLLSKYLSIDQEAEEKGRTDAIKESIKPYLFFLDEKYSSINIAAYSLMIQFSDRTERSNLVARYLIPYMMTIKERNLELLKDCMTKILIPLVDMMEVSIILNYFSLHDNLFLNILYDPYITLDIPLLLQTLDLWLRIIHLISPRIKKFKYDILSIVSIIERKTTENYQVQKRLREILQVLRSSSSEADWDQDIKLLITKSGGKPFLLK